MLLQKQFAETFNIKKSNLKSNVTTIRWKQSNRCRLSSNWKKKAQHIAGVKWFVALFLRYFGKVKSRKNPCLWHFKENIKNPSLKISPFYSLWHKQTSTYVLPHSDVPDILKCLTDALSLPQILSGRMESRLCQFPVLCRDTETWAERQGWSWSLC